ATVEDPVPSTSGATRGSSTALAGEHLCCVSRVVGWGFAVGPVCRDEGIGEDDELSHDGGEGEFSGFAPGDEAVVAGLEAGLVAGGGEGGHVEGVAWSHAATVDVALALAVAAVVGDRREAGEPGGGLARALAQLAEAGEQRGGDDRTDAGDGVQEGLPGGEAGIGGDAARDAGTEPLQMGREALAS